MALTEAVWTSLVGAIHHQHACHRQPTSLSRTKRRQKQPKQNAGTTVTGTYSNVCSVFGEGGSVPHSEVGHAVPVWSEAHYADMGVVQSCCCIHHPAGSRNILLADFVWAGLFMQFCVFWNQFQTTLNCAMYDKWARMWILMSRSCSQFFFSSNHVDIVPYFPDYKSVRSINCTRTKMRN